MCIMHLGTYYIHLGTAAYVLYEEWYRGNDMVLKISFDFIFHLHHFLIC